MKNFRLISIALIVASAVLAGCFKLPFDPFQVTPTAVPTDTQTPVPTEVREPAVYKVFVDDEYGFKRVIDIKYRSIVYENLTLYINVGDKIIWANDVDDMIIIFSEQKLWAENDTRAKLFNNKEINYTFTQPGVYSFYIREPRILRQKIIVNP